MLNPYLETIHQMVNNHSTSRQIYEHIKKQGFKGGFDSVRVLVTSIRKEMPKTVLESPNIKSYHRKATMHLYWKLHQQLSDEERQDLNYALATFPNTRELYGFVQYFRENMNHYDSLSIQTLIASINNHTTPEIKSFIKYLYKELESIILSIHYTYSNGSIEGQINRLKTIKRTLYGRAGFQLLRKRVLYRW